MEWEIIIYPRKLKRYPSKNCKLRIFDKTQAAQFVKQQGRQSIRYKGANLSKFRNFLIRKSQIFSYNLEDFIESWEDKISSESDK